MKKVKTVFICIPVIFLFFGCKQNTKQLISVKINMIHIPNTVHTAYLDAIQPANSWIIDTASINPLKGSFEFTLYPTGSEGLYRIRIGDSASILLALHNKDVKITGDYGHPGQLNIEGSSASKELQDFLTSLNTQNKKLHHLSNTIQYLEKTGVKDSLIRVRQKQLNKKKAALLDQILHEAQTTKSPVNAVFALSLLDDSGAWRQGKPVFDGLAQRFPKNTLVKQAIAAYQKKINNAGLSMSIGVGDQAPEISYPNPEGKVISLQNFRGKYVLVDFWASWCAPCRAANPGLVKTWNRFKDKNFAILGVSLDSKKSSWIKAIHHDHLAWPQISDLKGWNSSPAAVYGVEAIPANFLVNPQGKVIATDLMGDTLNRKLSKIFNP